MKDKWKELSDQFTAADSELDEFIENSGMSTIDANRMKKFIKAWNSLKRMSVDFDKIIAPVEPLEIKFTFSSEDFAAMWKRWKEYLSEQHGQLMRTRAEQSALEHLDKISKNNEAVAMEYLRYAMANRYRNFFAIDDADKTKPAKSEETKSKSDFEDK